MLSSILFSLAVMTTAITSTANVFNRYMPSTLPDKVYMVDYIDLLDVNNYFTSSMIGYDGFGRSDEYTDLHDDYLYVPYSLQINWNVNGYQIDSVECLVFDMSLASFPGDSIPNCYGFYTSNNNNTRVFGEYGGFPNSIKESTLNHVIANSFTVSAPHINMLNDNIYRYWSFSSFTGSTLSIINNNFINNLEPYLWNEVYMNGIPQSVIDRMKTQGYEEGFRAGKTAGEAEGYQKGIEEATSTGGIITDLFGGIISVPLNILNGLTPLVIWNIPIISIIFTFLVVALLLWIIRKFI